MASQKAQPAIRLALSKIGTVTTASWWEPFSRRRMDVWGIADLELICPGVIGTIYVQCTTHAGISSHKKKLLESPMLPLLVNVGNHVWLIAKSGHFRYFEVTPGNCLEYTSLVGLVNAAKIPF